MEYVISTAILIAGLAISYFQWRTAQQKVAIDLFGARHKIYEDLKEIIVQFMRDLNLTDDLHRAYIDAQNRARFYFGAEIEEYLETTRKDIIRGHYVDRFMDRRVVNVDEQVARLDRINAFYTEIDKKFIPYMRLDQRMPLWWWSTVFNARRERVGWVWRRCPRNRDSGLRHCAPNPTHSRRLFCRTRQVMLYFTRGYTCG